jgi:hypothetical protein
MTIINNIEIDNISYSENEIKMAIQNNDPIEEKLHVIAVISNPCLFAKRYILMKEFIERMEKDESNIILYIVEMVYGTQKFIITKKDNPRHLQLKSDVPLWHKENMINLGVKHLLPKNWKAFAWIDSDLEFDSASWATDTLKILNGCKDIVQVFSHCVDMDKYKKTMKVHSSAGYQYVHKQKYVKTGNDFWHPGYAWACTRKAYEKMDGIYQYGILGSGDHNIMLSLIGKGVNSIHNGNSDDYKNSILDFQKRIFGLRFGYVPGVISHHFHGSKANRKYKERWEILVNHQYSPSNMVQLDSNGIVIPSEKMTKQFIDDILNYFKERNEDE